MVIYIDVLLITNFIISYFLLISSAILTGYTYNRKRILFSSVCGAFSCLYIFYTGHIVLLDISVKLVSLFLCVLIAFATPKKKQLIIQGICFVFLNTLLMGIVGVVSKHNSYIYNNNLFFYININPVTLVILTLVVYTCIALFAFAQDKISHKSLYKTDICIDGYWLKNLMLFYDSGFKVKDIISNKNIIMLSFTKIKSKLPDIHKENLSCFLSNEYDKVLCRYIPVFFNTIQGRGMAPAIKAENIIIENKRINNILIAFVDNDFSDGVDGIFGNDIKKLL